MPVAAAPSVPVAAAPSVPGYANLPGPGTPGYANLPGPMRSGARVPSPAAPTVARALEPEARVHHELPTRRQLREEAARLDAQRRFDEPQSVSNPDDESAARAVAPVYAMGSAVSATQHPRESFAPKQVVAQTPAPVSVLPGSSVPAPAEQATTHTFVPRAVTPAPVAAAPAASATPTAPILPVTSVLPASSVAQAAPAVSPRASAESAALSNGPAYQPFGMTPTIRTGTMEAPTSVNTPAAWAITVLPALTLALAVVLIRFAPEFYTPFTQGALAFVAAIAGIALAVGDRRQLVQRSHQRTASPAWILLTPLAYLVARAVNTKSQAGRGWAPAIVFVVLTAGATALVYLSGLPMETFVVV